MILEDDITGQGLHQRKYTKGRDACHLVDARTHCPRARCAQNLQAAHLKPDAEDLEMQRALRARLIELQRNYFFSNFFKSMDIAFLNEKIFQLLNCFCSTKTVFLRKLGAIAFDGFERVPSERIG